MPTDSVMTAVLVRNLMIVIGASIATTVATGFSHRPLFLFVQLKKFSHVVTFHLHLSQLATNILHHGCIGLNYAILSMGNAKSRRLTAIRPRPIRLTCCLRRRPTRRRPTRRRPRRRRPRRRLRRVRFRSTSSQPTLRCKSPAAGAGCDSCSATSKRIVRFITHRAIVVPSWS